MTVPTPADCVGLGPAAIRRKFGVGEHKARRLARAARALAPSTVNVDAPPPAPRDPPPQKVEREGDALEMVVTANGPRIKTLEQLLEVGDVDLDAWSVKDYKLNSWEMATGDGVYYPLFQVKATLERKFGPALRPATTTDLPSVGHRGLTTNTAFFVPDTQHGFRWDDRFQKLTPMHDRKAIDCALQMAESIQPEWLIFLGDMLDCTEWSLKYRRDNNTRQTTQPAIDELYWQLRQFRIACPNSKMLYIAGNHEDRIDRALLERMPQALDLKLAGEREPLMTVARLLQLRTLDIEYVGPYGTDYWLWDTLRVTHAPATGTQAKAFPEVHGHMHDLTLDAATIHGPNDEQRVYPRMSPGCLCKPDGTVPGAKPRFNWQHGVGLAHNLGGTIHMQPVQIVDGVAVLNGRVFRGRDTAEAAATATGWPQIAG